MAPSMVDQPTPSLSSAAQMVEGPLRAFVPDAARRLEERGLLKRGSADHPDLMIEHVEIVLGHNLPSELGEFYREQIDRVGEFPAIAPTWNDRSGWRGEAAITELLHAQAVPIFADGSGNLFGLDLISGDAAPAVYFFDHERGFEKPEYAVGSSLGAFLLLLGEYDRAWREKWPSRWELTIDPDIDNCPRAPANLAGGRMTRAIALKRRQ